jgi:hypothetical protein
VGGKAAVVDLLGRVLVVSGYSSTRTWCGNDFDVKGSCAHRRWEVVVGREDTDEPFGGRR